VDVGGNNDVAKEDRFKHRSAEQYGPPTGRR
jgi:hypothetical protein